MTPECSTDQCDLPATHTDQFDHPICQECVDGAIFNSEPENGFVLIEASQKHYPDEWTDREGKKQLSCVCGGKWPCDKFVPGTSAQGCPYDRTTSCSCPESLTASRCTNHECKLHHNMIELALVSFNENFTSQGLAKMKKEVSLLPVTATNPTEYDLVYVAHQRFKNIHLACRRKAEQISKTLRANFKSDKAENKAALELLKKNFTTESEKINTSLAYVLEKIDPINKQLADARENWDVEQDRKKTERATEEAAKQEAERNRLEIARGYDQAHADNEKFDADKKEAARVKKEADQLKIDQAELKLESERLALEKRKFAREKEGLDFDDAWDETHWDYPDGETLIISEDREKESTLSQDELDQMLGAPGTEIHRDPDINELAEFAKDEPAAQPDTFATASANGLESLKNDDSIVENAVEASGTDEFVSTELPDGTIIVGGKPDSGPSVSFQTENFSDGPASIIYSADPAEKEKQLLEIDAESIKIVRNKLLSIKSALTYCEQAGFESKTATTATRRLIEDIQAAADRFSAAVTPRDQEPEITEKDCPF